MPEDDIIAETVSISEDTAASASAATSATSASASSHHLTSSPPVSNGNGNGPSSPQPSGRRLLDKYGISRALPTMRRVEDTLRGKLWRLVLGVSALDANDYKNQIRKAESEQYYVKIRGDTKRTFLTSEEYNSRVSEERLVRVLNSFVQRHLKPYC